VGRWLGMQRRFVDLAGVVHTEDEELRTHKHGRLVYYAICGATALGERAPYAAYKKGLISARTEEALSCFVCIAEQRTEEEEP